MNIQNDLKGIVGDQFVVTDSAELQTLGVDWTKIFPVDPLAAVLPKTTEEVSKVLAYCNKHKIEVVPSGGRTGLAGGAVAGKGQVVLSLSRMNKILNIDEVGLSIEVEAGVITENIQEAAKNIGLFFPLDLAAKGSSLIGGNISTNAGGLKLIRYGGTREQVLGLEVVLANGEILNMNVDLRKNNTGYDLKHLFIGAEGTLGVVTKATLRLMPLPKNVKLACLGVDSFTFITKVLRECHLKGMQITAFEFFTEKAHKIVLEKFPQLKTPFESMAPFYMLLEVEDDGTHMTDFFEHIFDKNLVIDGVLAESSDEFRELWSLRENITESLAVNGHVRKNDIALPVGKLEGFVTSLVSLVESLETEVDLILFGHIGDGNIHINYIAPSSVDFQEFNDEARSIEIKVFELVSSYHGSVSAEHGVGLLKKKDLHFSRSEIEISYMKQIKKVFDPNGIMNPDKIFP